MFIFHPRRKSLQLLDTLFTLACISSLSPVLLAQTATERELEIIARELLQTEKAPSNTLVQRYNMLHNKLRCTNETSDPSPGKCPKTFDGLLCWDEAELNEWAYAPCPMWVIGFLNDRGQAKKFCEANGEWRLKSKNGSNASYTDFMDCIVHRDSQLYMKHVPRVKFIGRIGFSMSLLALIVAIASLIFLKQIHCPRVILHINLFFSFLIFSSLQLFKDFTWINNLGFPKDVIEIPHNPGQYRTNENVLHWECRLVTSLSRYAESANHIMVFCEALYLSSILSMSTFNPSSVNRYIAVGWIGPLFWIVPYIALMAINSDGCWINKNWISYLYVLPQLFLVLCNFIMFVNIIRILVIKLRHNGNITRSQMHYKKLAKSTLTMLPFFSTYYIVFSWLNFYKDTQISVELDLIRLYFEVICSSFQGLIITCIFCFFNSEVQNETLRILNRNLLVYNTNRKSQKTKAENRIHKGEYRLINQSTAQDIALNLCDTDSKMTTINNNNPQREAPLVRFTKTNSDSDLSSLNSQLIHLDINPGDGSNRRSELAIGKKKKSQYLSQNYLSFKKYFRTLKDKHQYHGEERSHMLKRNSSTPNISSCSEYDQSIRRNTRKMSLDLNLFNRQTSINNNNNENFVL